jgi:hypothetical protein
MPIGEPDGVNIADELTRSAQKNGDDLPGIRLLLRPGRLPTTG